MRPKPPRKLTAWAIWIDYQSDPQHPGHFFPYQGKVPRLYPTLSAARADQISTTHSRVVRMEIKVKTLAE